MEGKRGGCAEERAWEYQQVDTKDVGPAMQEEKSKTKEEGLRACRGRWARQRKIQMTGDDGSR